MIYDKLAYHKTPVQFFLIEEVCSMGLKENRDARYDIRHSMMEYLKDRNSCKFPVEVLRENVPISILHLADVIRLKRQEKKPNKEMRSIRNNKLSKHQQ